jgi:hypothetical protein
MYLTVTKENVSLRKYNSKEATTKPLFMSFTLLWILFSKSFQGVMGTVNINMHV